MKILVDIGHPAHVHLYRNFIKVMNNRGHLVFVSVKSNLKSAIKLLNLYDIPFMQIGNKSDSIWGKAFSQIQFDLEIYKFVRANSINIGLGTSITNAHVSKITKMESIIFDDDDDEVQPLFVKYAHPYCNSILSPDVLTGKRKNKKTLYYPGYHELAYLHPNWFSPDVNVLKDSGLKIGEQFFIMRFNVFKAHHDIGVKGLHIDQKLELVSILRPFGKILITTERDIEPELSEYQMKLSPEKVHSLLAYSTLLIGDSQTMASEAAVLGVPSLRCNSFAGRISYLEEEEKKYQLTNGYLPEQFDDLKIRLIQLLEMDNLREEWQKRRAVMLKDKIDVTAFMVWFVEKYPDSRSVVDKNLDFFDQFR